MICECKRNLVCVQGYRFCELHCQETDHGHCSIYGCEFQAPHEGAVENLCSCCCGEWTHLHCELEGCGDKVCKPGERRCKRHCIIEGHGHCNWFCTEEIPCKKHRTTSGQGFCVVLNCTAESCSGGDLCQKHCCNEGHGHCVELCSTNTMDNCCEFHCTEKGHLHCSTKYCKNLKDDCASSKCKMHCSLHCPEIECCGDASGGCSMHEKKLMDGVCFLESCCILLESFQHKYCFYHQKCDIEDCEFISKARGFCYHHAICVK